MQWILNIGPFSRLSILLNLRTIIFYNSWQLFFLNNNVTNPGGSFCLYFCCNLCLSNASKLLLEFFIKVFKKGALVVWTNLSLNFGNQRRSSTSLTGWRAFTWWWISIIKLWFILFVNLTEKSVWWKSPERTTGIFHIFRERNSWIPRITGFPSWWGC